MKYFFRTISLTILIACSLPKVLEADYISPKVEPIVKQTVVYAKKEKYIKPDFTEFEKMIEAEFIDAPIMVDIANAESQFDPNAKNPKSTAKGLFQILDGTWKDHKCTGDPYDAKDNISCARKIYSCRGTQPWKASIHNWGAMQK